MEIKGKNGLAKVFTDNIDQGAVEQIEKMLDNAITEQTQVRIMPDVHYGKGATIGTTIRLPENRKDWKICPNVVGVDIGCSMRTVNIGVQSQLDLSVFDEAVHCLVPAGHCVHQKPLLPQEEINQLLDGLTFSLSAQQRERISCSLGTLGGGNHFYELGCDDEGDYWITVHSGSRYLGVLVANHHQQIAGAEKERYRTRQFDFLVDTLKRTNRQSEIQSVKLAWKEEKITSEIQEILSEFPEVFVPASPGLEYLTGDLLEDYLNDVHIAQVFSSLNRKLMLDALVKEFDFQVKDGFESMHNYVDIEAGIVRKGATSAQKNERLIIPINMRDGSIFAKGKGNPDWNFSAPHGAGRLLSRTQARQQVQLADFKESMQGIYSTSIGEATLDEAPSVYKPLDEIVENIKDTVTIETIVKPVYNFKAH
ncbi:TPA: RNA-splicing ligase RtcB [Streptococcus suis]|uniref:RNA-splicing ligase RtcB n=1 Tax=Streptococcus suis TaxID=1307 RepID=UPI000423C719|nr:RNA-splicing ligase RtcB [Streptococcus suis]NJW40823.1 RNA-splicing ligase RtcB [Streptococcus suis]HEM3599057.1 RNA-splicing ligase RtcB [Streptococcus suis]HEM3603203.1 RNA-splicing ligase RtcB [Streptococcus suis]HEM3605303.1 RNA-splicing ligase RtcB [Streptococcus suis]